MDRDGSRNSPNSDLDSSNEYVNAANCNQRFDRPQVERHCRPNTFAYSPQSTDSSHNSYHQKNTFHQQHFSTSFQQPADNSNFFSPNQSADQTRHLHDPAFDFQRFPSNHLVSSFSCHGSDPQSLEGTLSTSLKQDSRARSSHSSRRSLSPQSLHQSGSATSNRGTTGNHLRFETSTPQLNQNSLSDLDDFPDFLNSPEFQRETLAYQKTSREEENNPKLAEQGEIKSPFHNLWDTERPRQGAFVAPPPNAAIGETPQHRQSEDRDARSPIDVEQAGPSGGDSPRDGTPPTAIPAGGRPTANDACASIVNHLMLFNLSKDEDFSRKACESLIRKMKDKRGELDTLINAVSSLGNEPGPCVTIQRTLDGRLQVAGRKGFPHVVYAKIWRWPDLHKNELKHLPICKCAFDLKVDVVCVNPHHYERVLSPAISQMMSTDMANLNGESGANEVSTRSFDFGAHGAHSQISPNFSMNASMGIDLAPLKACLDKGDDDVIAIEDPNKSGKSHLMSPNMSLASMPATSSIQGFRGGGFAGMNNFFGQQRDLHGDTPMSISASSQISPRHTSLTHSTKGFSSPLQGPFLPNSKGGPPLRIFPDGAIHAVNTNLERNRMPEPPTAEFNQNWCAITYHEETEPVGETRQVTTNTIYIDGFFDCQDSTKFSLGRLTNIHRKEASIKCRQFIGEGIRMSVKENGDVWMECLGKQPVFVTSFYLDRESGRSGGDAVHKIYPGAILKVFDLRQCHHQLKNQASYQLLKRQQKEQMQQMPGTSTEMTSDDEFNNIGVDDFRHPCLVRVSFIKGWGPDYPRKTITETPCWIEVSLNRALELLDQIMHEPGMVVDSRDD
ncbi:unnamed protein product, partial [Mesorhabditis belari]|uniref:Mothers against decapentaplegic homolog n=1 Tax=Mesorhabditis belari TaxID=2138241 RepID=A0AAF3FAX4_9BILA